MLLALHIVWDTVKIGLCSFTMEMSSTLEEDTVKAKRSSVVHTVRIGVQPCWTEKRLRMHKRLFATTEDHSGFHSCQPRTWIWLWMGTNPPKLPLSLVIYIQKSYTASFRYNLESVMVRWLWMFCFWSFSDYITVCCLMIFLWRTKFDFLPSLQIIAVCASENIEHGQICLLFFIIWWTWRK